MNNYRFIFISFIILSNTDINEFIYPIYYNTEYFPENDDLLDNTNNEEEELENKEEIENSEDYDYYRSLLLYLIILCWIIFFLSFTSIISLNKNLKIPI